MHQWICIAGQCTRVHGAVKPSDDACWWDRPRENTLISKRRYFSLAYIMVGLQLLYTIFHTPQNDQTYVVCLWTHCRVLCVSRTYGWREEVVRYGSAIVCSCYVCCLSFIHNIFACDKCVFFYVQHAWNVSHAYVYLCSCIPFTRLLSRFVIFFLFALAGTEKWGNIAQIINTVLSTLRPQSGGFSSALLLSVFHE